MAEAATTLHPTIKAVTAEESEWRAIGFWEEDDGCDPAIRDVGRIAGAGYYYRELAGTSDPAYIDELDHVHPTEINRTEALELRGDLAIHWRERPDIARRLSGLWLAVFFEQREDGSLQGGRSLDIQDAFEQTHEDQKCIVTVEPDGTVEIRLNRDTIYEDRSGPLEWHAYRLPPKVYWAEHKVQLKDVSPQQGGLRLRRTINSDTITYQAKLWLSRLQGAVLDEEAVKLFSGFKIYRQ